MAYIEKQTLRPTACLSSDPVQSRPVDGDLVVDFVRLSNDPVNMLVLAVNLITHGLTKSIEGFGAPVDGIPITVLEGAVRMLNPRRYSQIVINLVLHLIILTIGLELILCSVCQAFLIRLPNDVAVDVLLLLL